MPLPAAPRTPTLAVIGPVAPFRGGIAQHTTRLADALSATATVHVVTFSRLYPRLLYPGRFQTEPDPLPPLRFHSRRDMLDTLRPRSWNAVVEHVRALDPDLVVIPWWTFFLAPCVYTIAARLRAAAIPVLFICHNVVDHEAARWKLSVSKRVLRLGQWFLVHATAEKRKLEALVTGAEVVYARHPVPDHLPNASGALPRRASIELLFYGFIRPYKGLQALIEAMALVGDLDVHLSIVGEPWGEGPETWQQRIRDAGIEAHVELVPRYVSQAETAEYFQRADAVVLPYTSATGTAVIATAARYGKPVLASRVGGVVDAVEDGASGLLFPAQDPPALAAAIRRFATGELRQAGPAIRRVNESNTWGDYAGRLLDLVPLARERRYARVGESSLRG